MGGCSFGEKSGGSIQGAAALHPAVGRHADHDLSLIHILEVMRRTPPEQHDFSPHLAKCDYFTVDVVAGGYTGTAAVSYTHLDVYKRQGYPTVRLPMWYMRLGCMLWMGLDRPR